MNITEMRNYIGVSRAEFSRRYNIPIRTLESWEAGVRTPPEYVLNLLEESVRRTDIIEVTFVYDTLLGEGKIHPWSKDLDDQCGDDQASYMTILSTVDRFRERQGDNFFCIKPPPLISKIFQSSFSNFELPH